ncbi:cytochrome P450, partial [Mycena rosella]
MISQIVLPLAGTLLCYVLFHAVQFIYRDSTSPLRHVVGPKSPSLIFGNFRQMGVTDSKLTEKWRSEFGRIFQFRGLFSISEFHTSDIKAINHVVTNSTVYRREVFIRDDLNSLTGKSGMTIVEICARPIYLCGCQNSAFGLAQIRAMTEVFVKKAVRLRDIWARQVAQGNGAAHVESLFWLRRATLDMIGQAGALFSAVTDTVWNYYKVSITRGNPSELERVFNQMFHSPQANTYVCGGPTRTVDGADSETPGISHRQPVPGAKVLNNSRARLQSIGKQIFFNSKANAQNSNGQVPLGTGRDLLSVLVKSNLSKDVPENQRLTEAEVVAQIPTFVIAGQETTGAVPHLLISLPRAYSRPLLTVSTDKPTMDELNALPYLEMVVKESLRVHAPIMFIQRMAMEDDVLPLGTPYIDKAGKAHDRYKGQLIHIPMLALNMDKDIWRTERWENVPDAANHIPSVWANLSHFCRADELHRLPLLPRQNEGTALHPAPRVRVRGCGTDGWHWPNRVSASGTYRHRRNWTGIGLAAHRETI